MTNLCSLYARIEWSPVRISISLLIFHLDDGSPCTNTTVFGLNSSTTERMSRESPCADSSKLSRLQWMFKSSSKRCVLPDIRLSNLRPSESSSRCPTKKIAESDLRPMLWAYSGLQPPLRFPDEATMIHGSPPNKS